MSILNYDYKFLRLKDFDKYKGENRISKELQENSLSVLRFKICSIPLIPYSLHVAYRFSTKNSEAELLVDEQD